MKEKDYITKAYFDKESARIQKETLKEIKRHNGILLEEFQSRMLAIGEHAISNTERITHLEEKCH